MFMSSQFLFGFLPIAAVFSYYSLSELERAFYDVEVKGQKGENFTFLHISDVYVCTHIF